MTVEYTCRRCNRSFPRTAEYFHRNRTHKDGLQSYCKHCMCHLVQRRPATPNSERADARHVRLYVKARWDYLHDRAVHAMQEICAELMHLSP